LTGPEDLSEYKKEIRNLGIMYFKKWCLRTHDLYRTVPKVADLEDQEDRVAEGSPITYCLSGQFFKPTTTATVCLLPLKCCVSLEHCCAVVLPKGTLSSWFNTSLYSLTYWHKRELTLDVTFPFLVL
jgi:hypothetical protein